MVVKGKNKSSSGLFQEKSVKKSRRTDAHKRQKWNTVHSSYLFYSMRRIINFTPVKISPPGESHGNGRGRRSSSSRSIMTREVKAVKKAAEEALAKWWQKTDREKTPTHTEGGSQQMFVISNGLLFFFCWYCWPLVSVCRFINIPPRRLVVLLCN